MERGSDHRPHPYWLAAGTGLVGVSLGAVAVLMGMRLGPRSDRAGPRAEVLAPVVPGDVAGPTPIAEPEVRPPTLVEAVARTRDAVVNLGTERTLGAGVIVEPSGVVVTNYHVIADALVAPPAFGSPSQATPTVRARFADGRELSATILVADNIEDLAILRLRPGREGERFTAVTLGESAGLSVGQDVFAIGNPFGLNHSVSRGIVSALERTEVLRNRTVPLIQLDASINLGNSGGPLFALDGSLVGIVTSRPKDAEGIAFAVPVDHVRGFLRAVSDPAASRRSGEIGLEILPERPAEGPDPLGHAAWLRVTRVLPESPAERAGLREGDRVVEVRGKRLDGLPGAGPGPGPMVGHLVSTVRSMFPGERLALAVVREGEVSRMEIEVAAAPSDRQVRIDAEDLLGLVLRPSEGVPVIARALPGTPFAGVRASLDGLELVRLVDQEIETLDDLGAELRALQEVVRSRRGPVRVRVGLRDPQRDVSGDVLVLIE